MFTVPAITFNFIKDNTDAELLAKPQLRIAEGEKAQLVIGDRIPIPVTTINTQQAVGGTGVIPITSFQYQDVGIKIDMEPRVHHNKEVSLKLTIEVSQITGSRHRAPTGRAAADHRDADDHVHDPAEGRRDELPRGPHPQGHHEDEDLDSVPRGPPAHRLSSSRTSTTTDKRTDLFLTLTPHIIRSPQITEEDLVPIWVGTENNVSFSGLNTRLESPNATGSPFDAPAAPQRVQPRPVAPAPVSTLPIIQGSGPNDPFKHPTPAPTPAPGVPRLPRATSAPAPNASLSAPAAAAAETSASNVAAASALADPAPAAAPAPAVAQAPAVAMAPAGTHAALALEATSHEIQPGEASVVNLTGVSGLAPLTALELTVEWNPAVAEVTGIAPGTWRDGPDAAQIGFEADRTAGRAHLRFARAGAGGLPDGVLARLAVKGAAAGTTLVRVTAGAASTSKGPSPAPVVDAAALTVKPAP